MKRTVEVTDFSPETLEKMARSIHAEFIKSDRARYLKALSEDVQSALADSAVMCWLMRQRDANGFTADVVQGLTVRVRRMVVGE